MTAILQSETFTNGCTAIDSIDIGESIPALPAGVPELLKDLTDDEIGFQDLTSKLTRFPSITSRLLFLANSSWSSPLVPIDSLDLACSKLGLSVIRTVSLALSIAAPFNSAKCAGFDSRKFWLSSLLTADVARALAGVAGTVGKQQQAALHTAGILHNIGILWLADRSPESMSVALITIKENPDIRFSDELKRVCGLSYSDINDKLAESWQFPSLLHAALAQHNNPHYSGDHHKVVNTLGLASKLAGAIISQREEDFSAIESDPRTHLLGISSEQVSQSCELIEKQLESISGLVDSYLAAQ